MFQTNEADDGDCPQRYEKTVCTHSLTGLCADRVGVTAHGRGVGECA